MRPEKAALCAAHGDCGFPSPGIAGIRENPKIPDIMFSSAEPFRAIWRRARRLLRPAGRGAPLPSGMAVPIRSLGVQHRERIAQHLLQLQPADRYLRFGYAASDEQVRRYVERLDFVRDEIFGIFNRRLQLIATAHLAFSQRPEQGGRAEFGVSVLEHARGRRLGARLFERAVMHARTAGVHEVFIHALSENTAMLRIARNAGATLRRDGSEAQAYLQLHPPGLKTRMAELATRHYGEMNYQFKKQLRQWSALPGPGAAEASK